jgi:hypothetical protein
MRLVSVTIIITNVNNHERRVWFLFHPELSRLCAMRASQSEICCHSERSKVMPQLALGRESGPKGINLGFTERVGAGPDLF